jgi:alkylhydroperoxidase family enzyme
MALIQTVSPEKAEGEVKEIYDTMQKNIGVIPDPLQLASASPWMLSMVWQSIQYFTQHPNLGFGLLSTIRYLVAQQYDYAFCTNFNKNFLLMQGMSQNDIEKIAEDPLQAPLEDKDRAMLAFVMKAIKTPDTVVKEDMEELHDMGWTDADILDALTHGTNMIGSSILMKAFKMDQTC